MKIQKRQEYEFDPVDPRELLAHPMQQFAQWLRMAELAQVPEANAFCLSTVDQSGQADARMLLLKEYDLEGLVFYTNYLSKKGKDLLMNPKAHMLFFWPQMMRQIRIQGEIEVLSQAQSAEYFRTRPLETQIGAMISRQSSPLSSRSELEEAFAEMQTKSLKEELHCPTWWGGYQFKPHRIEFWQGLPHRLHDRFVYQWIEGAWQIQRLYP